MARIYVYYHTEKRNRGEGEELSIRAYTHQKPGREYVDINFDNELSVYVDVAGLDVLVEELQKAQKVFKVKEEVKVKDG